MRAMGATAAASSRICGSTPVINRVGGPSGLGLCIRCKAESQRFSSNLITVVISIFIVLITIVTVLLQLLLLLSILLLL